MRILSLGGAGAVCQYATRDLAEFSNFEQIVIGDYNVAAAQKLAAEIGDPRLQVLKIDANDYDGLVKTFKDFQARQSGGTGRTVNGFQYFDKLSTGIGLNGFDAQHVRFPFNPFR